MDCNLVASASRRWIPILTEAPLEATWLIPLSSKSERSEPREAPRLIPILISASRGECSDPGEAPQLIPILILTSASRGEHSEPREASTASLATRPDGFQSQSERLVRRPNWFQS